MNKSLKSFLYTSLGLVSFACIIYFVTYLASIIKNIHLIAAGVLAFSILWALVHFMMHPDDYSNDYDVW